MKKILALAALLVLTGAGCTAQNIKNNPNTPSSPVACTADAKQCPDGSYVGRTGPKCEFTACPKLTPAANGEKIIKKEGEREGSFEILEINGDNVVGFWYQAYPVARAEGVELTLHIGDDIGYACEGVSEKLTDISFIRQTVTFTKITGKPPMGGCPI